MFKQLLPYTNKPVLFTKGTANFWDDPHISNYLLQAHLDPEWDAASRRPESIDKTVDWLSNYLPPQAAVLDLGCGPGLYAERLTSLGHKVTGVDFSARSIEHAQASAQAKGLHIDYSYQNYLEIDYRSQFDVVILIYCDFGALVDSDRDLLLQKVHTALKPGGLFIFDVHCVEFGNSVTEKQSWEIADSDFWSAEPHCVLTQNWHYPAQKVLLRQEIVLRQDGSHDVYHIYTHYYSEADLTTLLTDFRFVGHHFAYDVIEDNPISPEVVFTVTTKPADSISI